MLVHDRNAGLARIRPTLLVVLSARRRPDRADHGDFGVRGFDGVENLLEAVLEHVVDQVLVADARYSRLNGSIWPIAARLAAHLLVAESALQKSMRPSTSSM